MYFRHLTFNQRASRKFSELKGHFYERVHFRLQNKTEYSTCTYMVQKKQNTDTHNQPICSHCKSRQNPHSVSVRNKRQHCFSQLLIPATVFLPFLRIWFWPECNYSVLQILKNWTVDPPSRCYHHDAGHPSWTSVLTAQECPQMVCEMVQNILADPTNFQGIFLGDAVTSVQEALS